MLRKDDIFSSEGHIVLLYDNDYAREDAIFNCINKEIEEGKLAVYASVDADRPTQISRLESRIKEYKKNLDKGNLKVVNTKKCAERARDGDIRELDNIKKDIEQAVKERQSSTGDSHTVVVDDCADSLSKDEKFEECCKVERSWQNTCLKWKREGLRISVICSHLRTILDWGEEQSISSSHNTKVVVPSRKKVHQFIIG
jgi:hypothetical protein